MVCDVINRCKRIIGALNAIRMLTEEKEIVWDVVTCVNRKNINQLDEFKEFLITSGVKDWRIFTIFPTSRAARFPELQLSNDRLFRGGHFVLYTGELSNH